MSHFPDPGPPAECFPTIQDLHREMLDRRAGRLGRALGRIDDAVDELLFRIGGLASEADRPGDDDLEDAERVADALEIAAERLKIAPPPAASGVVRRGGWA